MIDILTLYTCINKDWRADLRSQKTIGHYLFHVMIFIFYVLFIFTFYINVLLVFKGASTFGT